MITSYMIKDDIKAKAISLYIKGLSAQEIKDKLHLTHRLWSINLWMRQAGVTRTKKEAFNNAIKRKRMILQSKTPKTF